MAGQKILIVEDDEDFQVLYGLYLQGEAFQVVRATNGREALGLVQREKPDLIVLDMIMPVMDGEEFIEKFGMLKGFLNTPIIIASVNDKIPKKLFEQANIRATLKKPFSIETLIDKIQEALK